METAKLNLENPLMVLWGIL